jgi:hypothetical protein
MGLLLAQILSYPLTLDEDEDDGTAGFLLRSKHPTESCTERRRTKRPGA